MSAAPCRDRPAPMVPPGVNLRSWPAVMADCDDIYDIDQACGTDDAVFRMQVMSLYVAWHQRVGASLPAAEAELKDVLRFKGNMRGFRRVREAGGLEGWTLCSDGRLYHPTLSRIALKALATKKQRIVQSDPTQEALSRERLLNRLGITGNAWAALRKTVFERDAFTCVYCDQQGGRLECDHIVPVSRGGTSDIENLATACYDCNRAKGAQLLSEWVR